MLTSTPQPVGAVAAYLAVEQISELLPFSFAFAAGAMLALVVLELVPQTFARGGRVAGAAGTGVGAALMPLLAATLGYSEQPMGGAEALVPLAMPTAGLRGQPTGGRRLWLGVLPQSCGGRSRIPAILSNGLLGPCCSTR